MDRAGIAADETEAMANTEWVAPQDIDLTGRFGAFVKYLYARAWANGTLTDFHRRAYLEHIRVFNNFLEMDDQAKPVKIGAEVFLTGFRSVLASIARDGFAQRHAVRVGAEGLPVDGEHRIAACLALNQRLCVRRVARSFRPPWGYRYFRTRGMNPRHMDLGMAAALNGLGNLRVAVIFGGALAHRAHIVEQLGLAGPVHYEKRLELSPAGRDNLVRLIYQGEPWLGRAEDGFPGVRVKSEPCFPPKAPSAVGVVFLQPAVSAAELAEFKERIRGPLGLGNHSLHITDTHEEARRIGDAVLSVNGVHLLNNRRSRWFAAFERDFEKLATCIGRGVVDRERVAVVGSAVLSLYGVRDARDLDIVVAPEHLEAVAKNGFEASNAHWESHGFNVREMLYDPREHCYFDRIKFLSLESLIKLKTKRDEPKDAIDLALIKLMVNRKSRFQNRLARMILLLRLYTNVRWLRSYFRHWRCRLGLHSDRRRQAADEIR